jgi:hypothetical protein
MVRLSWHYYKLYNVNFNKLPTELKKHKSWAYERTRIVSRFPKAYLELPSGNWVVALRSNRELDIDLIKRFCQKVVYTSEGKTYTKHKTYTKVHGCWKEREGY